MKIILAAYLVMVVFVVIFGLVGIFAEQEWAIIGCFVCTGCGIVLMIIMMIMTILFTGAK